MYHVVPSKGCSSILLGHQYVEAMRYPGEDRFLGIGMLHIHIFQVSMYSSSGVSLPQACAMRVLVLNSLSRYLPWLHKWLSATT